LSQSAWHQQAEQVMINAIFEQFVEASPVSVMMRATMERIFSGEHLDELF